jgi:hypothetical protein
MLRTAEHVAIKIDLVEAGEITERKRNARAAYRRARKLGAAPAGMLDRWWADTLVACTDQPERTQAVLLHRSEVLFALLADRTR